MKFQNFHKIIAITFALLILASSTTLSLDAHFCQSKLKSISLFGQAKSCHQKNIEKVASCHKTVDIKGKGCCNNKTLQLTNTESNVIQAQINSLQNINTDFLVAFTNTFICIVYKNSEKVSYKIYKPPPLISQNRQVLFQSFLI